MKHHVYNTLTLRVPRTKVHRTDTWGFYNYNLQPYALEFRTNIKWVLFSDNIEFTGGSHKTNHKAEIIGITISAVVIILGLGLILCKRRKLLGHGKTDNRGNAQVLCLSLKLNALWLWYLYIYVVVLHDKSGLILVIKLGYLQII